jgi:hypothetical protein
MSAHVLALTLPLRFARVEIELNTLFRFPLH